MGSHGIDFHTAIGEILGVADQIQCACIIAGEVAEANTLHNARDKPSFSYMMFGRHVSIFAGDTLKGYAVSCSPASTFARFREYSHASA